jgi:ferredoxin
MDAIQLKFSDKAQNKFGKAPVPETDLCLGCGVCVHKCPTGSLTLERNKAEIVDPPKNIREYSMRFMEDKKAGLKHLRMTNE